MIVEANQRFMAERMQARVRAHAVDHAPSVTAPAVVLDVLREAIAAVSERAAKPRGSLGPCPHNYNQQGTAYEPITEMP